MLAWQAALAALLGLGIASTAKDSARSAMARAVWGGVAETATLILVVSLLYWALGAGVTAWLDANSGAFTLNTIDRWLARARAVQTAVAGQGGWHVVAALVATGVAASLIGVAAARDAAFTAFAGAKVFRRVGAALAIAGAFGFMGAESVQRAGRFEAQLTDARNGVLRAYEAVAHQAEDLARADAVAAIAELWRDDCAASDDETCDPLAYLERERARAGERGPYDVQERLWRGVDDASDPGAVTALVTVTPPPEARGWSAREINTQWSLSRAEPADAPADRGPDLRDLTVKQIVAYAASRSYEAGVEFAREKGVAGEVADALLSPLLGDALSGAFADIVKEAVASVFVNRGQAPGSGWAVKARVKAVFADGPMRQQVRQAAARARAAVQRGAMISRAEGDADAARQAAQEAAQREAAFAQAPYGAPGDSLLRSFNETQRMMDENQRMMQQNQDMIRRNQDMVRTLPPIGGRPGEPIGVRPMPGRR